MLTFRAALEPDLDRLIDIHMAAFPDARGVVERMRNFVENPLGTLDDLHVAELGGTLVAHAFLFPLATWFGGARVAVGGIASVGVAPEARGRGVAGALVEHLHDIAHARGDVLTMLYAFRQGFYHRAGYAPVTPSKRFSLAPSSIPRDWRHRADATGIVVRSAGGDERAAIEGLYLRMAARGSGMLDRPLSLWNARFADERRQWFVASRGPTPVGYAAWSVVQAEPHARTRLVVHDLVALDPEVRRALLAVVGATRDQVSEVELEVSAADPLDRALVDLDAGRSGTEAVEHPLGVIVGGPLVRVLDAERALLARGYHADGALDIHVTGRGAPLRLSVEHGRAGRAHGDHAHAVRLDDRTLAAVLFGGLLPSEAVELGWAAVDLAATVAAADALLALPPFFSLDAF